MKNNISFLVMLYIPHIFNALVLLFSEDLSVKSTVMWSSAIILIVQLRKVIPSRLAPWIVYCCLNLVVLIPITLYTLETFFLLVTIGTFIAALYLIIMLHQFVNFITKSDIYLSIPLMLILSLIFFLVWIFGYFPFLLNLIETYPSNYFLISLTKYVTSDLVKTFFIALFSLILVYYALEALLRIVKSEKLVEKSKYQIILLFFFSFVALILPDTIFSLLYLSFAETIDSIEFLNYSNNNDYLEMFFYYMKSFYYSFCLHFAVPIPTTGFYSNMQHAVMSYPHLKVLQFLHYTQNKLVELTLFAVIAGHVSNALGLGTKNSNEDTIKAGEKHR